MLPFAGGLESQQNGLFIFALLAAVYFLMRPAATSGGKWALIKVIPVTFLAVIAWHQSAPHLLVAALILSAIGDYLLAYEGERYFLGGLAAFFLAHIAYIALFFSSSSGQLLTTQPWRVAVALAFLIHAVFMARRLHTNVPEDMLIPVFAYIAAISLMGLSAAVYVAPLVILGVLLFIISDTLLATGKFLVPDNDQRQTWIQPGVWVTYIAAQMVILLGLVA
jgi:uncharacterized membrane protein YhhN